MVQVPQIWHDYMGDPEAARTQRVKLIAQRAQRKLKARARAAATRLAKEAAKVAPAAAGPQHLDDVFGNQAEQADAAAPRRKRRRRNNADDNDSSDDEDAPPALHPDDPANFLKLGHALRLLLGKEITNEELGEAEQQLREYTSELVQVNLHLTHILLNANMVLPSCTALTRLNLITTTPVIQQIVFETTDHFRGSGPSSSSV